MPVKIHWAAVAAALCLQSACAQAQTPAKNSPPASAVVPQQGQGFSVPNRARTTTGFTHTGTAGQLPDGSWGWVDYPLIQNIDEASPAYKVGLRNRDQILAVNGQDARRARLFAGDDPGLSYVVRIRRGDEVREYTVVRVLRTSAK